MKDNTRAKTKKLIGSVQAAGRNVINHDKAHRNDDTLWYLSIAKEVGAARTALEELENLVITEALSADIQIDQLSEKLNRSYQAIYRRKQKLKESGHIKQG